MMHAHTLPTPLFKLHLPQQTMPKVVRKKRSRAVAGSTRTLRSRSAKALVPKGNSDSQRSDDSGEEQPPLEDSASTSPIDMTSGPPAIIARELVKRLRDIMIAATAAHEADCAVNAPAMSKYMRNQFTFFGFKAPLRRQLQKRFWEGNGNFLKQRNVLLNFLQLLWEEDEREMQGIGCDLAHQLRGLLLGETEDDFTDAMTCMRKIITQKSWWDTVDALSYPVVGYMVQQRPDSGVKMMKEWISEENLWLRRTAILHQLIRKEKTDSDLLFSFCLQRAHEKEFFIQKAIGWALRDYARANKTAVKQFVETNRAALAPLSIREALKHIH